MGLTESAHTHLDFGKYLCYLINTKQIKMYLPYLAGRWIMGEQVLNQFRSDKTLREDCVAIYESMGMDLNTAFRMFMERTRMVRGLPFPAVLPENKMTKSEARELIDAIRRDCADTPELSLEEINAEIRAARAERRADK